ncbi:TonB-dependent receptor domain-containing protein [Acidovorax sp.]|uniref:TonB-dependent receptor domain-containing protein n=1 Tax=Acidovorax sp. TaxID=1872122 RepID=UPI003A0FDBC5
MARPVSGDAGSCDTAGTCTRQEDGSVRNQGIELGAGLTHGPWRLGASATRLQAQQRQDSTINPTSTAKAQPTCRTSSYRQRRLARAEAPGLSLLGTTSYEGSRTVLPDESITLPAWARLDLGVRYETRTLGKYPTTGACWSTTSQTAATSPNPLPVRPRHTCSQPHPAWPEWPCRPRSEDP